MSALRVEEVLSLWRQAVRARDDLPPDDAEFEAANDHVLELQELYHRMIVAAAATRDILAASEERLDSSFDTLRRVRGGLETEGGPPARRDAQAPDIRPILVTFPHDDLAFAEHVFLAAERVGAWDRAAIMDRVRQSYPAAVAAEAEDIALVGGVPRWYVYRDGRASPRRIEDTWQDDPTTGVMVLDDEARYTDVNDAALELLGRQREDVVGTTAGGFTRHEDDAELSRRMFALADGQRLASIAIVVRPDGVERPIEFTMAHEDAGYVIRMRPIAVPNGDPVPAPV